MSKLLEKEILLELLLCYNYGWIQHPFYKKDKICSICLDNMNNKYVLETHCGHIFDLKCIIGTINHSILKCPDCGSNYIPIIKN